MIFRRLMAFGAARRTAQLLMTGVVSFAATGCAHVAPYQRGKLANPTMSADDLGGPGDSHVRAVLEGATGGSLGAESGCGCN